ncbi:hypothetical protein [Shewanella sp.]|uniref:hypothetical protein n=1 Tax=Shewanella sp. TaxID=50422 RepID=UPI003A968C33
MAYDLHSGISRRQQQYRLSLTEELHDELFSVIRSRGLSLPVTLKLADYYQDQHLPCELHLRWREELNLLLSQQLSTALAQTLRQMLAVLQQAMNENLSIYWFAD